MTSAQIQCLFTAKVAAASQNETGRVPSRELIDDVTLLARVLYEAVRGVRFTRNSSRLTDSSRSFDQTDRLCPRFHPGTHAQPPTCRP
jgi:hypothetical protein